MLLASTARLFLLRASKSSIFLIMMGVRLTPKAKHYIVVIYKRNNNLLSSNVAETVRHPASSVLRIRDKSPLNSLQGAHSLGEL